MGKPSLELLQTNDQLMYESIWLCLKIKVCLNLKHNIWIHVLLLLFLMEFRIFNISVGIGSWNSKAFEPFANDPIKMGRYSARNFKSDRKNQNRRCWVVHLSDAELGSTTLPMFEFLAKVELKNGWPWPASTAEPNTRNKFIQTPNTWGFSFEGTSGKWMKMVQVAHWPTVQFLTLQ